MIKPEHPIFYGLMICSLIGNLLIVAMTYIMAIGIDNLLEAIKRVGLLGPVLLLILFSIISSITSFIQERAMASLSERVTLRIRKEVTKKFKT